jgi:hypothetical protein
MLDAIVSDAVSTIQPTQYAGLILVQDASADDRGRASASRELVSAAGSTQHGPTGFALMAACQQPGNDSVGTGQQRCYPVRVGASPGGERCLDHSPTPGRSVRSGDWMNAIFQLARLGGRGS